ncbi:hypothetical protein [Acinetobacter sp. SH20PTE14]|nr:hypothetical protein [Acinetobacter sp. SH20PTE14]UIJ77576.1 hypothetical protein LXF01_17385 [Acinetobacter sp. SH20PTE14]
MRTLSEERLCNQILYKELVENSRHQVELYGVRNSQSKTSIYTKQGLVTTCLRVISEKFNPDFDDSPVDFFHKDFEKNEALILSYLKENYNDSRFRSLKWAFNFIVEDVLQYHNTKYWLRPDNQRFPLYENPVDRLLHCMNLVIEVNHPHYVKKKNKTLKKYALIAHEINKYCGADYLTEHMIFLYYARKRVPDFVIEERESGFFKNRNCKPRIVLEAIENLSVAPSGYLMDLFPVKATPDADDLKEGNIKKGRVHRNFRPPLNMQLVTAHFRDELYTYCSYKTEPLSDKERNQKWIRRENEHYDETKAHEYETVLTATKPTSLAVYDPKWYIPSLGKLVSSFVLILKETHELKLLSVDEYTLFNLSQHKIVRKVFSKILKEKEFITVADHVVIHNLSTMWKPDTCFFYEYADEVFSERYNLTKEEILKLAHENYRELKKISKELEDYIQVSDDSHKVRNRGIVELDIPAMYVFDMLDAAQKDIQLYKTRSHDKTIRLNFLNTIRDTALVMCLMEIPLRARNWSNMKLGYHPNSECIYKDEKTGLYVVRIPKHCFKNFKQKIIPDNFKLTLPKEVTEHIDLYVNEVRPLFLNDVESKYFLISSMGNKLDVDDLGHSLRLFTKKFGNQKVKKGGIGIHFFRDIVATTFLKKNKGGYSYVAFLLLDSERMIREHYGHLKPDDAFEDWQEYKKQLLQGKKEKGEAV